MECEICGRTAALKARIEGAVVRACTGCAALGEAVKEPQRPVAKLRQTAAPVVPVIHPDFSQLIRQAREQAGLTREQLAHAVGEKASAIIRTENGMRPDARLARKLEKALHLHLLGYEMPEPRLQKAQREELTLGDVVDVRIKKKLPH